MAADGARFGVEPLHRRAPFHVPAVEHVTASAHQAEVGNRVVIHFFSELWKN